MAEETGTQQAICHKFRGNVETRIVYEVSMKLCCEFEVKPQEGNKPNSEKIQPGEMSA